jgi:hypothetical protein
LEKIEAAQKEREKKEWRRSVAITMGKNVTEDGVWKISANRDAILLEVRSWRKQQENSVKGANTPFT